MSLPLDKKFIPNKVASELSGYNSDYIARLCREGKIEGTQIGRAWFINRDSLEKFIKQQDARKKELARELSETREREYQARLSDQKTTKPHFVKAIPSPVVKSPVLPTPAKPVAPRYYYQRTPSFGPRLSEIHPSLRQGFAVAATVLVIAGSVALADSGIIERTGSAVLASAQRVSNTDASIPEQTVVAIYRVGDLLSLGTSRAVVALPRTYHEGVRTLAMTPRDSTAAVATVPALATTGVGPDLALSTYHAITGFFTHTMDSIAVALGMRVTHLAVLPFEAAATLHPSTSLPAPGIENGVVTYTTVPASVESIRNVTYVQGVSQAYVESYVSSYVTNALSGLAQHIGAQVLDGQGPRLSTTVSSSGGSSSITSLDGVTITNSTITNSTFSGGSVVATSLSVTGSTTLSGITGSTQCLHVDAAGVISGTGSDCGAGGGGGGGITSLNGLSASTQTFATGTDANIALTVTSSGSTHTFTPIWTGVLSVARGGTGLASVTANQLLIGNSSGTGYASVATSSLGLSTSDISEGSNLYYTLARFASALAGTTTDALAEGVVNKYYTDARARGAFSTNATGLTYTSATGVLSLASGYTIPLSASTSDWNSFFTTPSSRITAGTNLSWSGSTLNGPSNTFIRGLFAATAPLAYDNTTGTFSLPKATSGADGYLSSTDWSTFNNKISSTSLSAAYPLQYNNSTGAFSLAFGTTTSNTWGGTQTFTNAPVLGTLSGLVGSNNGTLYQIATSSNFVTSLIAGTGIGVSGATGAVTVSNTGLLSLAQSFGSAQTGAITLATSSDTNLLLNITNAGGTFTFAPVWTGTLAVARGGTGQSSFTAGSLVYGAGSGALQSVGTSTVTASNGLTGSFTAVGSGGSLGLAAIAANSVLANNTSGSAIPVAIATSTFFGTGSGGQVLTWNNGVPQWVASTTYTAGTGISTSFASGALTITNTGVASLAANYPIQTSGATGGITLSLAFGTTTSNTWAGTQTFTNTVKVGSLTGFVLANNGTLYQAASSSLNLPTSALASQNVSQFTNDTGYITSSWSTDVDAANNNLSRVNVLSFFNDATRLYNNTDVYNLQGLRIVDGFAPSNRADLFPYYRDGGAAFQTGDILVASSSGAYYAAATSTLGLESRLTFNTPLSRTGNAISITQASASVNGYLSSTDWSTFNNKISSSSLSATYPVQYNGSTGVLSLAFGTTTANSWSSLQTFNGGASTTQISAVTGFFNSIQATSSTATSSFSGGLTIGSNTFAALQNGKIGIGNINPGTTLDITGTARVSSTFTIASIANCTGANALQTNGSGDISCGTIATGGASSGGGWTTNNAGIVSLSTTTDRVTVGASTTPYAKLSVLSGNAATTTLAILPASGQTANILDIYNSNSVLDTVITSTNFFGLGTTSPAQRLSVQGNALVSGNLTVANLTATGTVSLGTLSGLVGSNNGTLYQIATSSNFVTSLIAGTGIGVSGATGAVTVSNTGLLSLAQSFGSAQTGAITLATSSAVSFNGLTFANSITNSGGTFTFTPAFSGTLNNSGLTNSSVTVTAGSGLLGGGTVALGSSITLSAQIATSSVPTVGGLAYWTGNGTPSTLGTVATSTATLGLGLSGSLTGLGASNSLTIATSSLYTGSTNQILVFTGTNTVGASSTLSVAAGGTGSSTLTGLLKGNGTSGIQTAVAGTDYLTPTTGVTSITQNGGGTAQVGAITFATSSVTNNGVIIGLNITNAAGTFTFTPTRSGTLTVGGGGTGLSSVGDGQLVFGGAGGGTANLVALATSTGGFLTNSYTTGRPTWSATSTLFGTGSGGQILTWNNGVPQWVASTTYTAGTGISTSFASGALTITNTGVTSIGPTGQTATGAVTFASSTAGTDFTVTGSGSVITFNLPTASASNRGLLSSADWSTFNGKQASLAFSYPLVNTANTISLAFGTTTQNFWSAYNNFGSLFATNASTTNATTTGSFYLTGLTGSGNELALDVNNRVYKAATTTAGTGLSYNGTSFTVNSSQSITTLSNLSSNGLVYTSGGAGTLNTTATTSIAISGPFTVPAGLSGIGASGSITYTGLATTTTLSSSQILVSNGTSGVYGVSTSSATLSGAFTGSLTTIGSGQSLSLATNGVALTNLAQVAANSVLVNNTGALGNVVAIATSTFFGTGSGGQILTWNNGVPQWVATTTYTAGTGISTSFASGALTITNTGVTSIGPTGQTATGAVTFATSTSAFNGLTASTTITGVGSSLTFTNTLAGKLGVGGGGTGLSSVSDGNLVYGGGTTNPLVALATSTSGKVLQLDFSTGRPVWVATSTLGLGTGSGSVTSVDASGGTTGLSFTGGPITTFGTLTLSGTLNVANGGTGSSTLTGLLKGNGTSGIQTAIAGTDYQAPISGGTGITISGNTINSYWTLNGSNNLYNNNSGAKVGIGTTSPQYALDVAGYINSDKYSGYKQDGNTVLYASSTQNSTLVGINAGATFAGNFTTAVGSGALQLNTANLNTAIGYQTLNSNTSGAQNTAIGALALENNSTGASNVGIGYAADFFNSFATNTVAIGREAAAGGSNYANQGSVAIGYRAGFAFDNGSNFNTLIGNLAGSAITTGAKNVVIGADTDGSNSNLTTGSNNILIGTNLSFPSGTASNQLNIGNLIYGTSVDGSGTTLSSGSIGIGTTTPAAKFGVNGNGYFNGNVLATTFAGTGVSNNLLTQSGNSVVYADVSNANVAIGLNNAVGNSDNTAIGLNNTANAATFSSAIGFGNTASGYLSSAFGSQNTASNNTSGAFGASNNVSGVQSYAFGYGLTNSINNTVMIGPSDTSKLTITNAQKLGFGTTSPFADISVHANNGDTNTTLFAIGSSTASATTTLFSISNTGTITTALGSGLVKSTSGALSLAVAGTDYLAGGAGAATTTLSVTGPFTTNGTPVVFGSSPITFTYTGLATTTALTSSQLLVSNGTSGVYGVSTSTATLGLGLSGSITGLGASNSLTIATSSLYTGTTGQVPYFSGTNTLIGTSTLFINTSGNVGVGTTSTSRTLAVDGGTTQVQPLLVTGYNNGQVESAVRNAHPGSLAYADYGLYNDKTTSSFNTYFAAFYLNGSGSTGNAITNPITAANGGEIYVSDGPLVLSAGTSTSAGLIDFQVHGTSIARISAGGYFGIGTNTPAYLLTLASSTKPQLTLTDASATNAPFNFRAINNSLYISTSSVTTFATTSSPILTFNSSTGSTTILKLDVTGTATSTFGNGVNLTSGCFAVNGSCALTSSTGVTSIAQSFGTAQTGAITFATSSSNATGLTIAENITNSGSTFTFTPTLSGTLSVANGGTGLASLPVNQILYGGAGGTTVAGVATTSPIFGLGLTGSNIVTLSGGSPASLTIATSSLYTGTAGQLAYFSGTNSLIGTSTLFINTSGNVGVGTTSPYSKLSVWGNSTGNIFEAVTSASSSALTVSGTGFGTTTVTGLNINGSATTTSNVGINLTAGCYSVNGTCLTSFSNTLAGGGTATTTFWNGGVVWSDGSKLTQTTGFTFGNTNGQLAIPSNGWYSIGGNIFAYGSTTNGATLLGIGAGGNATTSATAGAGITAIGYQALAANTIGANGFYNTAVGYQALLANTTGNYNTGVGASALVAVNTQVANTAIGYSALNALNSGSGNNVAVGFGALDHTAGGAFEVGIGALALRYGNGTGATAVGYNALSNTSFNGSYDTVLGYGAGQNLTTGSRNILIGPATIAASQNQVTTGSNNIAIGNDIALPSATLSNQLDIGNFIYGTNLVGTGSTVSTSSAIGFGSTTPFAEFSLHAGASSTVTTLFAIGSSTASATTTLFSISNTGAINTQIASGLVGSNNGTLYQISTSTSFVTSLAQSFGSAQTGAITFATSSSNATGLTIAENITNSGSTFTFTPTLSGTLSVANGGTGLASLPVNQILYGGAGGTTVAGVATTSPIFGLGLSGSLTTLGSSQTLSIATSSLYTGTQGQVAYFSGTNSLIGTSTLFISTAGNVGVGSSTPGSKLSILSGSVSSGDAPNALYVQSGNGGAGSAGGNGGNFVFVGGNAGAGSTLPGGSGGSFYFNGGVGPSSGTVGGSGGSFNVTGGTAGAAGTYGGSINLTGGFGGTYSLAGGGNIFLTGGDGGTGTLSNGGSLIFASGNGRFTGGDIQITTGNGTGSSGVSGNFYLTTGDGHSGAGNFNFTGGNATSTGSGGGFSVVGGVASSSSGTGGAITLTAGDASSTVSSVGGGAITLTGGSGGTGTLTNGSGGNITLNGGAAGLAGGSVGNVLLASARGLVGIGTTSPYSKLSVWGNATGNIFEAVTSASTTALSISATGFGTTTVTGLNINGSATTTSNVGINLTSGCFAVNGTCVGGSSFTNTLANGGTATTTFWNGGVVWSDGSKLTQTTGFTFSNTNGQLSIPTNGWLATGGNLFAYASSSNSATLFGIGAGGQNATTSSNQNYITAIGYNALNALTTGQNNTGVGAFALALNTTGFYNTALGFDSLASEVGGQQNTAVGWSAGLYVVNGVGNSFFGAGSGASISNGVKGDYNVAVGNNSLNGNASSSSANVVIGAYAGGANGSKYTNVFVGAAAGYTVTTGSGNILIGQAWDTGLTENLTTGSNNIGLGAGTLFPSATGNNQLNIGNFIYGTVPATSTVSSFTLPTTGALGIGTSSPFAKLSIQSNNGDTATTLFAIGSSTASATTTLLSISNTGVLSVTNSATSTFSGGLNVLALNITGSATSTAANGINLTSGCFAVNGTCVGGSSFTNTLANGGTATTTFWNGGVVYSDGTKLTQTTGFTFGSTNGQLSIPSNGGYSIGGQLLAYASSTNRATLFGLGAGGQNATTTGASWPTAFGYHALNANTTGDSNTGIGIFALTSNTTGTNNSALGASALYANTGSLNSAFGSNALQANTSGGDNSGFGYNSLYNNTIGTDNTAVGLSALSANTTGSFNSALGANALKSNTVGTSSVAIGNNALYDGANISYTVGIGDSAGYGLQSTDIGSVYVGYATGWNLADPQYYNTFIGYQTGFNVTSGYNNLLIGASSSANLTTGSNNLALGNNTFFPSATANSQLNIGNLIFGTLPATTTAFKLPTSGAIGIGTSSPFAKFSIQNNNGDTETTLFAIGSSTASATTTLFSISNTGAVTLSGLNSALLTTNANGVVVATTTLGIAYGGTGTTTQITNGVNYYDGSKITSKSTFTFNGTSGQLSIPTNGWLATGGSLFAYASSTNRATIFGLGAGGQNATTSSTVAFLTAIGYNALNANTTGTSDTAVGYNALLHNISGANNVAIGHNALSTATSSDSNTAIGYTALAINANGQYNTAVGSGVLANNSYGSSNSALGKGALLANTVGSFNTALGVDSLTSNVTGSNNTAVGGDALFGNVSGFNNTGVGYQSLANNTTGQSAVALGTYALGAALDNSFSIGIGESAGYGFQATDTGSVYVGAETGWNLTGAQYYNNFLGYQAGFNVTSGYANLLIGASSSANLTTGSNNLALGNYTFFPSATADNQLNIGNLIYGTLPATTTAFTLPTSGSLGIGSSSPYAKFSIQNNNGDTENTLFAIGSSTASATTTLLSVSNTGVLNVTNSATSTFSGGLNVLALNITGSATSTATNGINLTAGCFAVNGTCVGGGSFTNTLANGGTATTTFYNGGVVFSDGSKLTQATGAGNSTFAWDNTNGRLGVGTSSPWGQLSVNPNGVTGPAFVIGSSTATNFIVSSAGNVGIGTSSPLRALHIANSGANSQIMLEDTGASADQHYGSFGFSRGVFSVNTLTDSLASTTRFIISATGQIGIATTSPTAKLAITGSGTGIGRLFALADSSNTERLTVLDNGSVGIGTSTPNWLLSVSGTTGSRFKTTADIANALVVENSVGSSTLQLDTLDSASSIFSVATSSGSTYFTIGSAGFTGVGTTSPYAKLSIQGNANDASLATTLFAIGSSTNAATTTLFSVSNTGVLNVTNSATSTFSGGLNVLALNITGSATSTAANGINLTSGCFAVNGTCVGGGSFTNTLANGGTATTTFYAGGVVFSDGTMLTQAAGSGNNIFNWDNTNGRLGVGTSSPWAQLSVNPNGVTGPAFAIGSSTATNFIVNNDGRVGVGTSSPTTNYTLSVTGTGYVSSDALVGGNLTVLGNITATQSGTTAAFRSGTYNVQVQSPLLYGGTSAGGQLILQSTSGAGTSDSILFKTGSQVEAGRFTTSGALGLGTSTPQWKLTVASSTGPQLTLTDASATNAPFNFRAINNSLYISTSSPSSFATTSTSILTLDGSTGNVGIGSTSPRAALGVSSIAGQAGLLVYAPSAGGADVADLMTSGGVGLQVDQFGVVRTSSISASAPVSVQSNANGNVALYAASNGSGATADIAQFGQRNGLNFTVINKIGWLGVGSTTPGAKLSIHANPNDATIATQLFTIGSSTATATTTLFNISNVAALDVGTSSTLGFHVLNDITTGNGIAITPTAAGNGVTLGVISNATAENFTISQKGSGQLTVGNGNGNLVLSGGTIKLATTGGSGNGAGQEVYYARPNETNISAGAERNEFSFLMNNFGNDFNWAAGTVPLQRGFLIKAGTYGFNAYNASSVITDAASFSVDSAPYLDTNGKTTNAYAILVGSSTGSTMFNASTTNTYGLAVFASAGATNNYAATFMRGNVGIGTLSPSALLTVNGTASTSNLTISNIANGSGQCLQINASGQVTGTGAACGGTGSVPVGATGALQFNNGGVFGGASGLIWDSTNSRLGVGSSTPWGQLAVNPNGISGPAFAVGSSTETSFMVGNDGNVYIGTTTDSVNPSQKGQLTIDMGSGTSENLIDGFGNVNDFLEYNVTNFSTGTNAQSGYAATRNDGSLTTGFTFFGINNTGFNNSSAFNIGNAGDGTFLSDANDLWIGQGTLGKKTYFTNGGVSTSTIILTFAGSGGNNMVGVGSTSPSALLSLHAVATSTLTTLFSIGSSTANATSTLFTVINSGNIGIGSSTPWAKLSLVSSTVGDETAPVFFFGTSTNALGANSSPLLYGIATTTGALDYARVAIGTTTSGGNVGLRDQLTVAGRIYSTWKSITCDVIGSDRIATAAVTADTTICGNLAFDVTSDANLTPQTSTYPNYARMGAGITTSGLTTEAAYLRTFGAIAPASANPVFETSIRLPTTPTTANSVVWQVGFSDTVYGTTTPGSIAQNGAFFAASSTANWIAIVRNNNVESRVDTGIATSTFAANFHKMRVELQTGKATFIIDNSVVAVISTNVPTANLAAINSIWFTTTNSGAATSNMDISYFRLWVDDAPVNSTTDTAIQQGSYNKVDGADIAENYLTDNPASYIPGIIVSNSTTTDDYVGLSSGRFDSEIMGAISTSPSLTLGDATSTTVRVAITGRVPVIVSSEGGAIHKGDRITSSSINGIGMRAGRPGEVVGKALEDFDPTVNPSLCDASLVDELKAAGYDLPEGTCVARIMVQVKPAFDLSVGDTVQELLQIPSDVMGAVNELSNAAFTKGAQLTKYVVGELVAKIAIIESAFVKNLTILPDGQIKVPTGENQVAGAGTIASATTTVFIANAQVADTSKIFITPRGLLTSPLAVTQIVAGQGFWVSTLSAPTKDVPFDYLIITTYGATATSTPQVAGAAGAGATASNITVSLLGSSPMYIAVGETYVDPGATVVGDSDPSADYQVQLDGHTVNKSVDLDTSAPGTHTITYTAIDSHGVYGSATRTVIIAQPGDTGSTGSVAAAPAPTETASPAPVVTTATTPDSTPTPTTDSASATDTSSSVTGG